jgi:hypothetical protein
MEVGFEASYSRWLTLQQVFDHYLNETGSEYGCSVNEEIDQINRRIQAAEVDVQVQAERGLMSAARQTQVLDESKKGKFRIEVLRAIVRGVMKKKATCGEWFAIGRRDGVGEYRPILPTEWPIFLMSVEDELVGGELIRFEQVRCAFTKDIPLGNPLFRIIQIALRAEQDLPYAKIGNPERSARNRRPGRPSFMSFVLSDFEARLLRGEVSFQSLAGEARALRKSFTKTHPNLPCPSAKTIKNNLKKRFDQAKSAAKEAPKL